MSNVQTYKIGVLIDADASKLQAEAKKADKAVDGIGKKGFSELQSGLKDTADAFGLIPESAGKASDVLGSVTESLTGVASSAGPVGVAVGAVVIGMTAAVGIGLKLSQTLFDLAKQTAEYGVEIANFNKLTGFSVQTIQALKIAADQTGGSLDEIEEVFESFVELMIKAGEGAEEEVKKVKSLGLDPQKAFKDLEGSFLKVLDKIREMPTQSSKAKVAMDGMGESGLNMVKVADAMTGGTQKYIQSLKESGRVMDADGIAKSKEFDQQLKDLTGQVEAITRTFAVEFMPEITSAMASVSNSFKGSGVEIKYWGEQVGFVITGTIEALKILKSVSFGLLDAIGSKFLTESEKMRLMVGTMISFMSPLVSMLQLLGQYTDSGKLTKVVDQVPQIPKITEPTLIATKKTASPASGKSPNLSKTAANSVEQDMRKTFTDLGFTVVRTFGNAINKGSLHPLGKAIDLSVKGKATEELFNAAIVGINKGWQLVDERVPRIGKNGRPIKQTGPHFHFEKDSGKDPSLFLDAKYYGGQAQLEYLQKLDKARLENRLSGAAEFQKKENEEINKGIDFVQKYTESFNALGETTRRIALEREKDFQKLSEPEKERLRLIADEWDALEKASKASDEYSDFIAKLNSAYDELNGVQKTYSERLREQLKNLKETGVVLDATGESFARYRAFLLDTIEQEKALNEELETQRELRLEQREWLNYDNRNKGITAPDTSTRERYEAEPPKSLRTVSAWSISNSNGSDFAQDGVFDSEKINTQISLMQTLKESGMDAFRSIAGEIGNAAAQWLAYGDSSEQSLGKATKAILASVSAQALGTGLYELGIGFAALTPWGAAIYGPAPLHFKSAAVLLGIGAAFGGLARAVPGGNNSKSGGGSNSSSNAESQSDNRKFNFVRDSTNIGSSQNQANNGMSRLYNEVIKSVEQLTSASNGLKSKIETQPAGILVAKGIKENPGLVSQTVTSEMAKNSTTATNFGRVLGVT